MRTIPLLLLSMLLLAACSTPRYTYHFDHYDYNSGKKTEKSTELAINPVDAPAFASEAKPLSIPEETLVASSEPHVMLPRETSTASPSLLEKKYFSMTKSEKKEFKKEVRNEIKNLLKGKKKFDNGASTDATKAMDYNLKMALIFGVVALVLSLFGGVNSIFYIVSVVALVVGVVFFVKWIAEQ